MNGAVPPIYTRSTSLGGRGTGRQPERTRRNHSERYSEGVHVPVRNMAPYLSATFDADSFRTSFTATRRKTCREFNSILDFRVSHTREAGRPPTSSSRITIADGIKICARGIAAGQDIDSFAPRLSFFWAIGIDLIFMEVAKLRARAPALGPPPPPRVDEEELQSEGRAFALAAHPFANLGLVADSTGPLQ